MRVPYNWLREYIDIPWSPEELSRHLTMAGIEVEAIQIFAPLGKDFVVGRIEALLPHPAAKNLQLVKVSAGKETLDIVCGARNIKVGDLAALALPGAVMPGGRQIQVAEVKGVISQGMLCSAGELGLDTVQDAEGILILDGVYSPGERLADILFVNEPVLELDLTPNRADCLGLLGVAREIAAQTGGKIKFPAADPLEKGRESRELTSVEIRDPELCLRYTARVMEGFEIAPSPINTQLRLLAAGIRAIDNLVDVTNYIMWETGFPMHAFDYDKLEKGRIVVRRARPGEEITTLDGVKRSLDPEVLVIADDRVPVALAGVMGGEHTEITEKTTRLLLEAACFNPISIRRTARKMNLPSEASQRYEKGVDPEAALFVQNRAVSLMHKLAGGEICRGIVDNYPRPYRTPQISLRPQRVNAVLGYAVSDADIKEILERLGLAVEPNGQAPTTASQNAPAATDQNAPAATDQNAPAVTDQNAPAAIGQNAPAATDQNAPAAIGQNAPAATGQKIPAVTDQNAPAETFKVTVPSFRRDLFGEIDLIEEIARIKGFEKIPLTLPRGILTSGRLSPERRILARFKEILVGCGLQEIITLSFLNSRAFDDLGLPPGDDRRYAVKLQNPLTEDQGILRTTLIPNILQVLQYNFHRQVENQLVFELGKVFIPAEAETMLPQEKTMLCLALSGRAPQNDWQNPPRPLDFFYLKGVLEALLAGLGIGNSSYAAVQFPFLHPTRGAALMVNERQAGFLGALHPAIQERYQFKQEVYLAEVAVDQLTSTAALLPSFKPLPRYPAVFRDIAFTVSAEVSAGSILHAIRECGGELLEEIRLFDVYKGSQIPEGYLSLAFALTFRHSERTLKDVEIDAIQDTMENILQKKYGAALRKL